MKYFTSLIPFVAGWALLLVTDSFAPLGLINGILQLTLFTLVVCIPIWMTGRMSYVDIGWPLGLSVIGGLTWIYSDGDSLRVAIVSLVYLFVGSRMGLGALKLWSEGRMQKEFPRYEYQKQRWVADGKTNTPLAMQVDALWQGLANASFLALPVFIIASNTSSKLSGFELVGLIIWALAFVMETLADIQKLAFLQEMKKQGKQRQVCNVGLWRFCRHPNYFAEWMVWNGLIIAAIPSWWALQSAESTLIWGLIGAGLLFTSRMMYSTLVYLTGAVPSEYYSAQKRPDYITYQQRTNRFFPGPPRE